MDSLRLLAEGTDGLAVLKRTAVDEALPRIVADESSYYLVTYRSSNTKLDGRFRTLSARVTRPGVKRADAARLPRAHHRRAAERAAARTSARPASAGGDSGGADVTRGARSASARRRGPLPTGAPSGSWASWTTARARSWSGPLAPRPTSWCSAADGTRAAVADPDVKPADGAFAVRVPERGAVQAGRVRGAGAAAAGRQRQRGAHRHGARGDERVARRGARHARGVAARPVDRPAAPADGRRALLAQRADPPRTGRPPCRAPPRRVCSIAPASRLQVPVQVSARPDDSGQFRWIVADAVLAPLAPGQYAIEVTLGTLQPDVRADARSVSGGAFEPAPLRSRFRRP